MPSQISHENIHDPVMRHAHTDFLTLRADQTVAAAMTQLRQREIGDRIVYLYVLDDQDRLAGVVPVRKLLTAPPEALVRGLMVSPVVSAPQQATVHEACEIFLRHGFLALPVVHDGRVLGVVDLRLFSDEVNALARQQVNSTFQLIGVHVSLGRRVSAWRSFKDRFPWLLCNIASGLLCALIVSRHELLIREVLVLAMFLTVVLALGESVSMQAMTLTLQGLLVQRLGWRQMLGSLRKEFATAAFLGAGCGAIVALVAWAWRGRLLQGVAVGVSILLAVVTSCLLGVLVPTVIRALRIDPKVAAGPIVLAMADVATLAFYFYLAQWMLGH
jgi:magnesium transporter